MPSNRTVGAAVSNTSLAVQCQPRDADAAQGAAEFARQARRQLALPAEGGIEAGIGFGDMQLGRFARAHQLFQRGAQLADQREQRRRQHFAMVHVDDGVGLGGVKADMQAFDAAGDLEDGAAAACAAAR